ncbi:MAG: hypothetical protein SGI92_13260 [Bryobacteraceae bacterium]|nr:hypothetical protein [Bryobacteraceae bacterium]
MTQVTLLSGETVVMRCLALTAAFETSTLPPDCFCGITGDFDGQGLSFGALQWNLGRGTLQPLLWTFLREHDDLAIEIFGAQRNMIEQLLRAPVPSQLNFVRRLQNQRFQFQEPWRGMLTSMGQTPEFQAIQCDAAGKYLDRAKALVREFALRSQRGLALMFDIAVQNGSINKVVTKQILKDFASIPEDDPETEKLITIARRRAAASVERFRADVLARKLTIAEGVGTVHGLRYNLADQFGLTLEPHGL